MLHGTEAIVEHGFDLQGQVWPDYLVSIQQRWPGLIVWWMLPAHSRAGSAVYLVLSPACDALVGSGRALLPAAGVLPVGACLPYPSPV